MTEEIQIQEKCRYCIDGVAGYITPEMAIDGGVEYLPMIGQPIHCTYCGGDGVVIETVVVDAGEEIAP